MKITALIENTAACEGVAVEHGLSLYIEANGKRILFDMGQTAAFVDNADRLGVDIAAVDFAVISHGHYDHGGGIGDFLRVNKCAPVFVLPSAFLPHYDPEGKYIGLDASFKHHPRVIAYDGRDLGEGITLLDGKGRERLNSLGDFGFTELTDGKLVSDRFEHEQHLLVEEGGKRVLVCGCSHQGIIDLMEWFKPDVVVGGFHFAKLDLGDNLQAAAARLDSFGAKYYTCHCTGLKQYEYIGKFMSRLHYIACGDTIII